MKGRLDMKVKCLSAIGDYLFLTLGCIVFALSWEGFMIPNNMSAGGLMGLCTVIQYATADLIPASWTYVGINILLIIVSMLIFGISFGFRTIYCILLTTLLLEGGADLDFLHAVPGKFFYVSEPILIPVIAGFLEAVGVGLIIRKGGSTGGTDIIALMVNKYWPVSLSTVFLLSDLFIICSMLLLPGRSFSDCVYGFEMMITFSLCIDFVVGGQRSSFQVLVFSSKYQEIADYVINVMDRGVTVLKSVGWYTKTDKNVLLVLINKQQLPAFSKMVKEIDSKAFMSVSPTSSVYGEGFDEIKAGMTKSHKKRIVSEKQESITKE